MKARAPKSSIGTAEMPRTTDAQLHHAIVDLLAGERRPLHAAEIATRLAATDRVRLGQALDDLVFEGTLAARPGRRFQLAPGVRRGAQFVEGAFLANPRGFGFVRGAARELDVFIPGECVGGAMHGDIVRARVVATSARGPEGEVAEILERRLRRVVGVVTGRRGYERLEPDDARVRGPIQLTVSDDLAPRPGLAAVAEIERYPEQARELPLGRLIAVLGEPGDPEVEVEKVLLAHNVAEEQPEAAAAEARAFGDAPAEADLVGRADLTHIPFVTIDPHDARDHDDAVWVERDDDGRYKAWIAIADVSHYVRPHSAIDQSALERGTSVYLPDRAVPMLPRELSGKLCSLLEGELRLCLAVEIDLDATGAIVATALHEGFMRSRAYLTYNAVASALGFTALEGRDARAEAMRHELGVMWDLSSILHKRRMRRGALDLDVPEAEIVVDRDTGAPVKVSQRAGDPGVKKAYRLIEELMLLANEVVAAEMIARAIPTIFRVHGAPDAEKIVRLAAACEALGVPFDPEAAERPQALAKFVRSVASHANAGVIHGLVLRAMQQATYDTVNIGHYGLASPAYLHFTSPIRRYPDLVVHRLLRPTLRGEARPHVGEGTLRTAAARASELERNAMEVEREVADVYRTLYMRGHLGERFDGVVSAISTAGVWVRLAEPFVDVLVPNDRLGDDSYEPDGAGIRTVGVRSGDAIVLGDSMRVEIEDAVVTRRAVLAKRIFTAAVGAGRPRRAAKRRVAETGRRAPQAGRRAPKGAGPKRKVARRKGR
jgi:ribonuclease R